MALKLHHWYKRDQIVECGLWYWHWQIEIRPFNDDDDRFERWILTYGVWNKQRSILFNVNMDNRQHIPFSYSIILCLLFLCVCKWWIEMLQFVCLWNFSKLSHAWNLYCTLHIVHNIPFMVALKSFLSIRNHTACKQQSMQVLNQWTLECKSPQSF